MQIDPLFSTSVQIFWLIGTFVWFLRRYDELPLIASGFLFYVFSIRYWVLKWEWTPGVSLKSFGIFQQVTADMSVSAMTMAVLGQTILLTTYMLTQGEVLRTKTVVLNEELSRRLGFATLLLTALALPLVIYTRASVAIQMAAGKSAAFEVSGYLFLFPFSLIGMAILIFATWKSGSFPSLGRKRFALIALILIAVSTYNPTTRFQFLGWVIAGTIIATSDLEIRQRLRIFLVGGSVAAVLFGTAGALRKPGSDQQMRQAVWERVIFATDANMLDGFVMLQQVYPSRLDFRYGGEHLEILTRPIPRFLWKNKPVGGYMNKLGLYSESGATTGISPSIFGSFFEEGGVFGVVIISVLYGFVLAKLMIRSARINPFKGLLLRGCLCAALLPLLRGGDLPGVYAWFGMSFWPCVLVVWNYRYFLPNATAEDVEISPVETGPELKS